jgi:ubiquinone/menaquinone biosynthesis C-methylase UbiE
MSNWNSLAELDPLWTILSEPEKKFGKWDATEFFATGNPVAQRVIDLCENNGVNISFGKMLDFGCGVGRMTRAFSAYFQSCVGIDVSENMVNLARKHNKEFPKCEFVISDSPRLPFSDASFDFVFTVLVLQHLKTKRAILGYISDFVRVVQDGGVIVFQLPIQVPLRRRIQLRRRVWAVLTALGVPQSWMFTQLGLTPIQMNGIAPKEVEKFLRSKGAPVRVVELYEPEDPSFYSNYYVAVREPRSPSPGQA